jgi:hypothetical protein
MMKANELIRFPDPKENVRAEVREVIKEAQGHPHIFARLKLAGWHFPQRAPEPFMVVGEVVSKYVEISPDGLSAQGYFDVPLPASKRIGFGYGRVIQWDFNVSIDHKMMVPLDRARLPKGTIDPFRSKRSQQQSPDVGLDR